jgi:hypothetical protein
MKKGRDTALPFSAGSRRRYFADSLPSSRRSFLSPTGGFAGATLAPDWLASEFGATLARANAGGIAIASGKAKGVRFLMVGPIALVVEFGKIDPPATQ